MKTRSKNTLAKNTLTKKTQEEAHVGGALGPFPTHPKVRRNARQDTFEAGSIQALVLEERGSGCRHRFFAGSRMIHWRRKKVKERMSGVKDA